MQLTCLRHGETPSNVAGRFNGHSQEGITPQQREAFLNIRFDVSGFDVIYCSRLNRCRETAQALGIETHVDEGRIVERHLGIFDGLTAAECRQQHPDDFSSFMRLDADFVIPGGESRAAHLARVLDWLQEAAGYDRVLAITHGGTIDFLYRLGTDRPPHGGSTLHGSLNGSVSTFDVDWPRVRLLDFSRTLAPSKFDHFLQAQEGTYHRALTELRQGRKQSHWMWYIFPQLAGLGRSSTAKRFAIAHAEEARAYLQHPTLRMRLMECTAAVLALENRSASEIFGSPDDLKFCSSMTLFEAVSADTTFTRAIEAFFAGNRDGRTLELLGSE